MKFRLGDTVRVINRTCRHFDKVGRITTVDKSGPLYPFHVTGLQGSALWYGPDELILAEKEQS